MSQPVTQEQLDKRLSTFKEELKVDFATKTDLTEVISGLATKDDVQNLKNRITDKFSVLQAAVDRYLLRTEDWHDEQTIMRARHNRLSQALIRKGVVMDQEISLQG